MIPAGLPDKQFTGLPASAAFFAVSLTAQGLIEVSLMYGVLTISYSIFAFVALYI